MHSCSSIFAAVKHSLWKRCVYSIFKNMHAVIKCNDRALIYLSFFGLWPMLLLVFFPLILTAYIRIWNGAENSKPFIRSMLKMPANRVNEDEHRIKTPCQFSKYNLQCHRQNQLQSINCKIIMKSMQLPTSFLLNTRHFSTRYIHITIHSICLIRTQFATI